MANADNILFRCSSLGHIMTEAKGKTGISETCKKHLIDVYVSRTYGRNTNIHNRYTIKGLAVEEDSLTLYSRVSKKFYVKNEDNIKNEFICGTPDIIADDKVIDIKSSWDIITYYRNVFGDLNKQYYWQLQGYMALTGKDHAELAYCLVNTPDTLVNDQKRRLMWSMGLIDATQEFDEACAEIEKLAIYDDIPMQDRVHVIKIDRDEDALKKLYERVTACREYMNQTFYKLQTA